MMIIMMMVDTLLLSLLLLMLFVSIQVVRVLVVTYNKQQQQQQRGSSVRVELGVYRYNLYAYRKILHYYADRKYQIYHVTLIISILKNNKNRYSTIE